MIRDLPVNEERWEPRERDRGVEGEIDFTEFVKMHDIHPLSLLVKVSILYWTPSHFVAPSFDIIIQSIVFSTIRISYNHMATGTDDTISLMKPFRVRKIVIPILVYVMHLTGSFQNDKNGPPVASC
jgi:hypothetical protein